MENNKSRWHTPSGGRGTTDNSEQYGYNRQRAGYAHSSEEHYSNTERPNVERRRFRPASSEQERRTYNHSYRSDTANGEGYRPRFNPNAEAPRPRRQRFVAGQGDADSFRSNRYTRVDNRQGMSGDYSHTRSTSPVRREGNVYTRRKQQTYRQQEVDPTKPIRLNKYLANAGICSRREADDFIQAGVITVNGEVVTMLGAKVLPTDKVMFHDQPVRSEHKVYILLNKPKDCVTTTDDPQDRKTVLDIVKNACSERIYPVGRLDRNTTGVLLLTNDGDLAAKLTHPKYGKKKVYAATLDRDLEQADYDTIMAGITLDDELIVPDALEFTREDDRRHIGLEIHSGQNRVVRRIFEKVGYKVLQLDRVSFAGLTKKNVPRGKYRFLTPREVAMLQMGSFR